MKLTRALIIKFAGGLAISALCLYFALKGIDFNSLSKTLLSVKIPFLLLFLFCLLLAVLLRAAIYCRFLRRKGKIHLFTVFEGIIIGYMVNSVFPLRAGDIVKAHIIGKLNNVSKTYTFTLAIIERLFDMITLLMAFLALLCIVKLDSRFKCAAQILSGVIMLALLFIFASLRCGNSVRNLLRRLSFIIPEKLIARIEEELTVVQSGFSILRDWRDVAFIQMMFFMIWGCYICATYVTGLSINLPLGFTLILFLLVAVCFGTAIAASPGGLGIHQYACVLVFSYFHYSREEAITSSLINNTLSFITPIILGWIFLLHTNLSLAALSEAQQGESASVQS